MTATLTTPEDSTTLEQLEAAVRACWARDTCDPDDLAGWRPDNPARGQSGVTALLVHDLLGGDLMLGTVRVGGQLRGFHWWNVLPGEREVDLTREQFGPREIVGEAQRISRPAGDPRRRPEQYEVFRGRVFAALGHYRRG
jgi:hypothetical protein